MEDIKIAELKNIFKIYGGSYSNNGSVCREVLSGVSINFYTSELHALLGENGAGKSTLVNIFAGLCAPSSGTVKISKLNTFPQSGGAASADCKALSKDNLASCIAMVSQTPSLVKHATVFENIILGAHSKHFLSIINRQKLKSQIQNLISKWNVNLNLNIKVKHLPAEFQFYTSFFSALYKNPVFLILDEPAAVFTGDKKDAFFKTLINFAKQSNTGVILITHKPEETLYADRISILKNGKLAESFLMKDLSCKNICAQDFIEKKMFSSSAVLNSFSKKNICCKNVGIGLKAEITFFTKLGKKMELKFFAEKNKITGIIGFPNSGLEVLEDILSGMISKNKRKQIAGSITIYKNDAEEPAGEDFDVSQITPKFLLNHKIGVLPSNRYFRASNPFLTAGQVLSCYRSKNFFLHKKEIAEFTGSILKNENIPADENRMMNTLSGGQIQRIILARCLAENPNILVLAEPAWGLDLLSIENLKHKLKTLALNGKTIIVLTKEFDGNTYSYLFDKTHYLEETLINSNGA